MGKSTVSESTQNKKAEYAATNKNKRSGLINLGVLAHVDAGKTTLTERLLLICGAIRKAGSVDGGDAHTDSMAVERERGISVKACSARMIYKGTEINLIDTPGHADFSGEIERSLRALDNALLLVSAADGVQPQTEAVWKALSALKIPTFFFINKTDRAGADVEKVRGQIKERLGVSTLLLPRGVDFSEEEIVEAAAENDLNLLEKYLNGESISQEESAKALRNQFAARRVFPLLAGSALTGEGTEALINWLHAVLKRADTDEVKPLSLLVYRIEHHPAFGKLAHVRMFGGKISVREEIENSSKGVKEKISLIKKYDGVKLMEVSHLNAGETGALCGLAVSGVGDVYGDASLVPGAYEMTRPLITARVFPESESGYPALLEATRVLNDEDPPLNMLWVKEQRELVLTVTGLIQIEILQSIYKSRFNLSVTFGSPTVIYKETPSREAFGFEAYTMPKPCWAVIKFLIEPLPAGSGIVYESKIGTAVLQPRYQAQIEQAIPGALRQGPRGWEVTDAKIFLIDGQSHIYHTHPLDFIVATPMAFMNGLAAAGTDLLEPYMAFTLSAPEELAAKVLGEITAMRGRYDETEMKNGTFTVKGVYPLASGMDFPVRVAVLTSGKGVLATGFSHYAKAPDGVDAAQEYRGVSPLDRAKYILHIRHAL